MATWWPKLRDRRRSFTRWSTRAFSAAQAGEESVLPSSTNSTSSSSGRPAMAALRRWWSTGRFSSSSRKGTTTTTLSGRSLVVGAPRKVLDSAINFFGAEYSVSPASRAVVASCDSLRRGAPRSRRVVRRAGRGAVPPRPFPPHRRPFSARCPDPALSRGAARPREPLCGSVADALRAVLPRPGYVVGGVRTDPRRPHRGFGSGADVGGRGALARVAAPAIPGCGDAGFGAGVQPHAVLGVPELRRRVAAVRALAGGNRGRSRPVMESGDRAAPVGLRSAPLLHARLVVRRRRVVAGAARPRGPPALESPAVESGEPHAGRIGGIAVVPTLGGASVQDAATVGRGTAPEAVPERDPERHTGRRIRFHGMADAG